MTGRRRLIVTGAAGYLGSAVVEAAIASGSPVTALVRPGEDLPARPGSEPVVVDWADPGALADALRDAGEADVVHCAGMGVRSGADLDSVDALYESNVGAVWRLLAALGRARPGRVVVVSSAAVYGPAPSVPTTESAPLDPSRHYAASKIAAEAVAAAFRAASGIATVVARPFNIIGPGEPPDSVVGVIAAQLDRAQPGAEVEVHLREDRSVRDFLDVRDVADALVFLSRHGESGGTYNVCSGTGTGLASLTEAMGSVWRVRARSVADDPSAASSVSIGDPSALRDLGWSARWTLDDALARLRDRREGGRP